MGRAAMVASLASGRGERLVAHAGRPARVERARGYPYERPPSSYVLVRQTPYCFRDRCWQGPGMEDLELPRVGDSEPCSLSEALSAEEMAEWSSPGEEGWAAVLAVGSNAAVSQLCRKYPVDEFSDGVVIPCVRAVLEDFDVTFAP